MMRNHPFSDIPKVLNAAVPTDFTPSVLGTRYDGGGEKMDVFPSLKCTSSM